MSNEKFEIKSNFTIIHYDELPILYLGNNVDGDFIIGSFVFENEDANFIYMHSIVTLKHLTAFLLKKVSYLEVLRRANKIALIERDINEHILNISLHSSMDSIPQDYLPLESSYCPETLEGNKVLEAINYTKSVYKESSFSFVPYDDIKTASIKYKRKELFPENIQHLHKIKIKGKFYQSVIQEKYSNKYKTV